VRKEFTVEMTFVPELQENRFAAAKALRTIEVYCTSLNAIMYGVSQASIKHFEEHGCAGTACSVALDYAKTFTSLAITQETLNSVLVSSIDESTQMVCNYIEEKQASRLAQQEMDKVYESAREKMLNKKGKE